MEVNAIKASETLIKYLIYINGIFLVVLFFIDNIKWFAFTTLLTNFLLLLLSKGMAKEADKIEYRASNVGKTKEEIKKEVDDKTIKDFEEFAVAQ